MATLLSPKATALTRTSMPASRRRNRKCQRCVALRNSPSRIVQAEHLRSERILHSFRGVAATQAEEGGSTENQLTEATPVTIEFQREKAKEVTRHFREQKQLERSRVAQFFGWMRKNEIINGRWVMFGLLVGMMTEYATGTSGSPLTFQFPEMLVWLWIDS